MLHMLGIKMMDFSVWYDIGWLVVMELRLVLSLLIPPSDISLLLGELFL